MNKLSSVYGLIDALPSKPQKKKLKIKRLVPKKVNPDLKYNAGASTSDTEGVINKVDIPIELLKDIKQKSQLRGQILADMMLRSSIPSIMGFSSAVDYTTSVLVDGFGIRQQDIAVNSKLDSVLNNVGSLEVVYQFIKSAKLPKSTKKLFLSKFTEKMSETCAQLILSEDKRKISSEMVKNGIITSRKQLEEQEHKSNLGKRAKRR